MRMPGVGGSALMVNSLAGQQERALRKRQMKDDRTAQAVRLGLAGVNVLGDLGTNIYAIRSRNENEAAEHALRRALQEKGQTFLREQAGYEHGLGAGDRENQLNLQWAKMAQDAALAREGMASDVKVAGIRSQGDDLDRIKLAHLLGKAERAGTAPRGPTEAEIDPNTMAPEAYKEAVTRRAQRGDIQTSLFGQEPRLDPGFYRGLGREQGFMRTRPGSELGDELLKTLATLKNAGLTQDQLDEALAALRDAKLNYRPQGGGGISFTPALGALGELLRGQAPGTDQRLEQRLLDELLGGGGPVGPPSPQEEAEMQAFARRRRVQR